MSGNWSTGLFAIFDDLSIFIYGLGASRCLAINNSVVLGEGKASFGLDSAKIAGPFQCAGFIGTDGAFCVNCAVCTCLPCVYILWRGDVRKKFGIQGSFMGDLFAALCCACCAIMQDSRELKIHGLAYGEVQAKTMDK
ncbi:hypothetical protein CAOG_05378 [Capsaspora owczarzaki ATCC 30864]|uniref:Uncharacterized protein n=1 Tax=Capsaspora owczarzaki (strain ATCC 30864) TaxID=595528 RepID=A0A0D2WRX1_CAPO3|nr:hypothetical protein CAOG_05378 [Capsaspora owczarzaki ATCC 30864]KJE94800.1 hypothetical protein CAOG_005378 [Capsaspora owczarzaki ATCC 30864]|eukprot:XP_004347063.1 hypothetical protein CAOG_05378 [Capsaspora owczarzaki ATCC 30864]